jgi:hypothetical protein
MRNALLATLLLGPVSAQAAGPTVQQSGVVTPGHVAQWTTNGVVQDGGASTSGSLTNLGLLGAGVPFCINDAPISSSGGYHQLCLGALLNGGAALTYNAYGGAAALPFSFYVNGQWVPFLSLPSIALTSRNIFVGTASNIAAAVPVSGDATITNAGAVTIGSLNGQAVSLAGPLTTAGAYPLALTLTGSTSLTLPTSGTVVELAATQTLTNKSISGTEINSGLVGVTYGGTGLSGASAANGTLLIGNGTGYTLSTLTGTTSNLSVTNAAGSITLAASAKQLPGTATNDAAAAGNLGELISATVLSGSAVSLSNNTAKDVTSISLTAGDWDVWGNVAYVAGGTTIITNAFAWTSQTSATLPTAPNTGAEASWVGSVTGVAPILPAGMQRISLGSTTTVYLSTQAAFTVSTLTAYGYIGARRVR